MAILNCTIRPASLGFDTYFSAYIPDDIKEDIPTVYLLHGLSDGHQAWMRYSRCEDYARRRGIALIMPEVGRSFYTDMAYGPKYFTYVADELFGYTRQLFRLSEKREKTFICGLSMGGYGAFKIALSRPERFAAAVSMSGCLDAATFADSDKFDADTRLIWGRGVNPHGGKDDLLALVDGFGDSSRPKPALLQFCGTEDYLYGQNQVFRKHIENAGFDYTYSECPGDHVWKLWDSWLPDALDFFINR